MRAVRYTLLGDGSSDRALAPVLDWLFRQHLPDGNVLEQGQIAELGRLRNTPPLHDLAGRIRTAVEVYPCDVLFVHRDAEQRDHYANRRAEVDAAIQAANISVRCVPVIPVRMTEAWLLIDEASLRRAADHPNGRAPLSRPTMRQLEQIHAKDVLFDLFRAAASQRSGRRQRFSAEKRRVRLATLIDDFSPLRRFQSFQDVEREVESFCASRADEPDE